MAPGIQDPRMTSIRPRIRYNTVGGVNGPLVILENVWIILLREHQNGSKVAVANVFGRR